MVIPKAGGLKPHYGAVPRRPASSACAGETRGMGRLRVARLPVPGPRSPVAIQRLARRTADRGGELRGLRRRELRAQERVDAPAFGELRIRFVTRARDHQHEFAETLFG